MGIMDDIDRNMDNRFDEMRARADESQQARINETQRLYHQRSDGAEKLFNDTTNAVKGLFNSEPPKSSSSGGGADLGGLLLAGAAVAGVAYLLSKLFGQHDMTIEKICDIVSPSLDDTIKKYEKNGLNYSAGKFSIKYADEKHFQLEFEMYFKDEEGKWHKCTDESDLRDYTLLEAGAWKKIQDLKNITFPIEKPKPKYY